MMMKNLQFYLKKLGDLDDNFMIKDYEQKVSLILFIRIQY